METTDTLLVVTVIILSITQIIFFAALIKVLIDVKNLIRIMKNIAESTDNTINAVRQHFTKQWPTISLLSWGIKKLK